MAAADKRNFYEDEKDVQPVPGTITSASDTPLVFPQQKVVNGVVVSSPSTLESAFKVVRESVFNVYSEATNYVNKGYNKYNTTERKVTNTVSQLHDKSEDLFPNSVYIFIAALSGTIIARQRSIVAKATFPIILGVGSFKYFLPNTFASTTNFVWKLEQQKLPEVAKQQENLVHKSAELVTKLEKSTESGQKSVSSSLESLKGSIKKYTGLNVDDDATKK